MSGPVTNIVIPIGDYSRMVEDLTRLNGEIEALKKWIEDRNAIGLQRASELLNATQRVKDLQHDLGVTNAMLDHAKALNGKLHAELAEANEDNAILYNAVQNMLRGA